jgi:peptide/nickel transport system substrate-binding protein
MVIMASDVATNQRNFNPLSPSANVGTKPLLYEPLLMTSMMQPGKVMPWLASKYEYTDNGTTLTLTLRTDVKWSDGQPFSSADVAYTFQAMLDHPALNTTGLTYTSVSAPTNDTVVLTWAKADYSQIAKIANVTPVAKHSFGSQDPQTFTNADPIGTGPFTLKSYSVQSVIYDRNPNYWQADKITVPEIQFPIVTGNALQAMLSQSKVDWSDAFVPDVDKVWVGSDSAHNKYWYPADGFIYLGLNLKSKNLSDVTIRKAVSLAIDRDALGKTAELGYEQPISPTGLVLPAYQDYLSPQYANLSTKQDLQGANQLLDNAGYARGSDGVRVDKNGTRLEYTIMVPSGFTDWVTVTKLLQSQLAGIGVKLDLQGGSSQQWVSNNTNGNFDMTLNFANGGPSPYQMYEPVLRSTYTAPVGKPAASNYVRWSDPATDKYFADFASTDDPAKQKAAIQGIEDVMVNQLPVIPLLGSADWYQYRTANYTGWPDATNAYAMGMPSRFPDNLLVLTHLVPAQ